MGRSLKSNIVCIIKKEVAMMNKALAFVLILGIIFPLSAAAAESPPVVRFEGGIGVIPAASNLARTGFELNRALNLVRPARYPWVISGLEAEVIPNGRISVVGRGLLNGGGPNIGTNRTVGQVPLTVFASLLCDGSEYNSSAVSVDPNGDFKIDGVLTDVPPSPCLNPVLLIRNGATGDWHAAGIPMR